MCSLIEVALTICSKDVALNRLRNHYLNAYYALLLPLPRKMQSEGKIQENYIIFKKCVHFSLLWKIWEKCGRGLIIANLNDISMSIPLNFLIYREKSNLKRMSTVCDFWAFFFFKVLMVELKKEKSQIKPLFRFGTQREQKLIFQTPTSHQALKPVKILKAGTHQRNVGKKYVTVVNKIRQKTVSLRF